ncbi:MAG: hypothetical protein M3O15_07300 [Acidobacteriota bacterium]|nr:hypothetical protein [Acidobacteriota bacterium]
MRKKLLFLALALTTAALGTLSPAATASAASCPRGSHLIVCPTHSFCCPNNAFCVCFNG